MIAPTTPIGTRRVKATRPSPMATESTGTTSPLRVRAATAEKRRVEIARSTSARAVVTGLPASSAISRAKASRWSASSTPNASSSAARSCAGSGWAADTSAAASIASAASDAPVAATRPTSSWSYGERTSATAVAHRQSPATEAGWTPSHRVRRVFIETQVRKPLGNCQQDTL